MHDSVFGKMYILSKCDIYLFVAHATESPLLMWMCTCLSFYN